MYRKEGWRFDILTLLTYTSLADQWCQPPGHEATVESLLALEAYERHYGFVCIARARIPDAENGVNLVSTVCGPNGLCSAAVRLHRFTSRSKTRDQY